MTPELAPQNWDGCLDHVVEECSELIKAVIKIKRFGIHSRSNLQDFITEAGDINQAVGRVLERVGALKA